MVTRSEIVGVLQRRVKALKADMLLVYTMDTTFRVDGNKYGPRSWIFLNTRPDYSSRVTSTATAMLMDVRTGFVYATAESTGKAGGLHNVWESGETVDRRRVEAEQNAFDGLVTVGEKMWQLAMNNYSQKPKAPKAPEMPPPGLPSLAMSNG